MVRPNDTTRHWLWPMFAVLVVFAAFALGRVSAKPEVAVVDFSAGLKDLAEVRKQLDYEQARLDEAQSVSQDKYLGMARELGKMQAGLDRLNALGETLAEMALIEPERFDFDAEPPLGGPVLAESDLDYVDLPFESVAMQLELRRRQLDVLEHLLVVSQLHQQAAPQGWPVSKGWISSAFGTRSDPFTGKRTPHHGLDFAAADGSDILAVASGIVAYSGKRSGYGNCVEINHGNGYVTRYAHTKRNLVQVGDRIERGQVIAHVGRSGRSTGPHLHFEVMVDGKRVDPAVFVARSSVP